MAKHEGIDLVATSHYFIGGGAEHTAEMVRRSTYAHNRGAEGISEPGDLKVLPLAVPGQGVRVVTGAGFVKSRYQGAIAEMYMGAVTEQEILTIEPAGSQAARSDLIVLRIRDPFVQGSPWNDPGEGLPEADAEEARARAKYAFIEVIAGVPAGTTRLQNVPSYANDTAITLGRVDLPKGEGTVNLVRIVDLRSVAIPRWALATRNYELVAGDGSDAITTTTAYPAGATWPSHVAVDDAWSAVAIPEWATNMRIVYNWNGVRIPGGAASGYIWCQVGMNVNPDRVVTQARRWDAQREGWRVAGTVRVPASMRGTTQKFFPRATRLSGSNSTAPILDSLSGLDFTVEFFGDPV